MEAKKNFQRGHIADCSDGFMSIHISSSSSNYPVKLYTLNMSSVFLYQLYLNKVVQKTKMQSLWEDGWIVEEMFLYYIFHHPMIS